MKIILKFKGKGLFILYSAWLVPLPVLCFCLPCYAACFSSQPKHQVREEVRNGGTHSPKRMQPFCAVWCLGMAVWDPGTWSIPCTDLSTVVICIPYSKPRGFQENYWSV